MSEPVDVQALARRVADLYRIECHGGAHGRLMDIVVEVFTPPVAAQQDRLTDLELMLEEEQRREG